MKIPTPEEFAETLRGIRKVCLDERGDKEKVHKCMDVVICDLLTDLGYGEAVDIFVDTPKWYA